MNLGYYFDLWKEGNIVSTEKKWYMISWSAKELNGKQITRGLNDYPLYKKNKEDDSALVKDLWELFNTADILIAHNGDRFDIRKANARFIAHKLPPPSPYRTIDTLKIARRHFKFDSNKLDDLGDYLGVGRKLKHSGYELWLGCMAGDSKSWGVMKKYNKQDVNLLESVYLALRPWAKTHPTISFTGCPNCSSTNLQKRGIEITKTHKRQRYQCQDCGSWSSQKL